MITCLDSFDSILVSGGLDKKVVVWDLRMLATTGYTQPYARLSVDEMPVLKVAIGPSQQSTAVSTLAGLFMVDFLSGTPKPAQPFPTTATANTPTGKKAKRYHDLKWNSMKNILYAAGDDGAVDQYVIQP